MAKEIQKTSRSIRVTGKNIKIPLYMLMEMSATICDIAIKKDLDPIKTIITIGEPKNNQLEFDIN